MVRQHQPLVERAANSDLLKVLQYLVTAILLPLMFFVAKVGFEKLEHIQTMMQNLSTQNATFELRVQALERAGLTEEAARKVLMEQVLRHDYEIRRLDERITKK